jgi:hypothetical protein
MRRPYLAVSLLLALGPVACGGDAAEDGMNAATEAMQDAVDNLAGGGSGEAAEPMTAEEMQDALPEELAGMERTSTERQSVGAAGMNMAQAQATYEGEGRTLEVALMSGGGILAGPAMAFSMVDFDRSTDTGYERTIEYKGMKGMQEYDEGGDRRRATMMLLVNNSLLVRLEAEGMTMDEVEDAFDDLDIS